MKSVRPWPQNTECPEPGFVKFKNALNYASFHNAGMTNEMGQAKSYVQIAAEVAIEADWPYWAMERMFREIAPLVEWGQFMQTYINVLNYKINEGD
jgi:hypothetical protein